MLKPASDLPFTLASPKEKEGWLNKRGDVVKNWKKRYVILYEHNLYYFRSKPNPTDVKVDLAGTIPLLGSALGEEKQIDNKEFCFSIALERRKYFIQATSEKEKLEWMDCIAKKVASLNIASMSDANMEDLVEKTGFTKEKLQKYITLFSKKYTSGTVSHDDFIQDVQKAVYRGSETFWREMYITLFGNVTSPPSGSTRMSPRHTYTDKICLREFLIGMSRVKNATSTQKLVWAFKLLDENNDGKLSVDELNSLVYSPPRASEFEGLSDTDEQKYSVTGILKRINLKDADNIEFSHFAVAFQDDKIVQNTVKFCLKSALQAASECKYKMFDHQVAGHKGKMAMLADETGNTILKPLNSHEYGFYDYLKDALEKDPKIPAQYFPKFYGSIYIEQPNSSGQSSHVTAPSHYIILENLLKDYKSPSVMDIKMGGNSSGTDPKAGVLKRFKQSVVSNMTTSHVLGFRVAGMKVWQTDGQVLSKGGLESSKNVTALNETMRQYFFNGKVHRVDVIPKLVKRLEELIAWFTEQETFLFLSSSVLLMYDGESESADVKMIDFAHSFPAGKRDETYLFGLQNLRDTLKALQVDLKEEVSGLHEAMQTNPNIHQAIDFTSVGDSAMKDASKAL